MCLRSAAAGYPRSPEEASPVRELSGAGSRDRHWTPPAIARAVLLLRNLALAPSTGEVGCRSKARGRADNREIVAFDRPQSIPCVLLSIVSPAITRGRACECVILSLMSIFSCTMMFFNVRILLDVLIYLSVFHVCLASVALSGYNRCVLCVLCLGTKPNGKLLYAPKASSTILFSYQVVLFLFFLVVIVLLFFSLRFRCRSCPLIPLFSRLLEERIWRPRHGQYLSAIVWANAMKSRKH